MARGRGAPPRGRPAGNPQPEAIGAFAIPEGQEATVDQNAASFAAATRARIAAERGVDPASIEVKTFRGGQHANLRALTHKVGCMSYKDMGVSFRSWNEQIYEKWLANSYSPSTRPWYEGKPPAAFSRYSEGEFGRALIQSGQNHARHLVSDIRQILEVDKEGVLFYKFETMYTQEEREDAVLRTFERPIIAAEKFNTGYPRDETPELTLERMTTGNNFYKLILDILPDPDSTEPYSIVRSPGGVWERLQDPEFGSKARMTGLTSGQQVWIEDGYTRRHVYLVNFCLHLLQTIIGVDEDKLEIKGITKIPHLKPGEREVFSADVLGHESIPPKRRPDALKPCTHCGKVETDKKPKYTCCARCKEKMQRYHYYCSRDCQVADWKVQHKAICGRPLADTLDLNTGARHRRENEVMRQGIAKQLRKLPRGMWYAPSLDDDNDNYVCWVVPTFVRPFRPTIEALKGVLDKALTTADAVSIGLLSIFVRLSSPYTEGGGSLAIEYGQDMVCRCFAVSEEEMEEMVKAAEREVEQREEFELVNSCFKQLKAGKGDPSLPDRTIPDSLLFFFDLLEQQPDTFYANNMPPDDFPKELLAPGPHPRARGVVLPTSVTPHKAILAAARKLAYRVLEDGGKDRLASAMMHLLYCASQIPRMAKDLPQWDPEAYSPYMMLDRWYAYAIGRTQREVATERRYARSRLEDLVEDEEYKLIVSAIEQFDEQVDWVVRDDDDFFDEKDNTTSGQKKRNKKKKKKAKKATTDAGPEGEVDEEVVEDAEE